MNNVNYAYYFNLYGSSQPEVGGTSSNVTNPGMEDSPERSNVIHLTGSHIPTHKDIVHRLETHPQIMNATKQELLMELVESEWRVLTLKRELQEAQSKVVITQAQNTMANARASVAEAAIKHAESKIKELKKEECYVGGLVTEIQGSVIAPKPESTRKTSRQMINSNMRLGIINPKDNPPRDKNGKKFLQRKKGKFQDDSQKEVVTVYAAAVPNTAINSPRKPYYGPRPFCNKCNYHHYGICRMMFCDHCKKKGHTINYCKIRPQNTAAGASRTCDGYGWTGHIKKDCPKVNRNNQEEVPMLES